MFVCWHDRRTRDPKLFLEITPDLPNCVRSISVWLRLLTVDVGSCTNRCQPNSHTSRDVIVDCYSISASRNMMPNDRHLICLVRLIDALNEKIKMKIYSVPCDILREKVAI